LFAIWQFGNHQPDHGVFRVEGSVAELLDHPIDPLLTSFTCEALM
jgi:hypothetical protein